MKTLLKLVLVVGAVWGAFKIGEGVGRRDPCGGRPITHTLAVDSDAEVITCGGEMPKMVPPPCVVAGVVGAGQGPMPTYPPE